MKRARRRFSIKDVAELGADTQRLVLQSHSLLQQVNSTTIDILNRDKAERLPDVEAPVPDEENPAYWRGYRARVREIDDLLQRAREALRSAAGPEEKMNVDRDIRATLARMEPRR